MSQHTFRPVFYLPYYAVADKRIKTTDIKKLNFFMFSQFGALLNLLLKILYGKITTIPN